MITSCNRKRKDPRSHPMWKIILLCLKVFLTDKSTDVQCNRIQIKTKKHVGNIKRLLRLFKCWKKDVFWFEMKYNGQQYRVSRTDSLIEINAVSPRDLDCMQIHPILTLDLQCGKLELDMGGYPMMKEHLETLQKQLPPGCHITNTRITR